MSIVIVQKTLVHVLSEVCEQSERERERADSGETGRERERVSEKDRQTDRQERQRNRELSFYLFDSFTTS